jgi:phosphopantothenoylcysteine decarboxylase/phosphopantothenate--cysteine ligase
VKRARKGCDYLVANEVSGGAVFGEASTSILIVSAEGERANLTGVSKADAADGLWDIITSDR